MIDIKDLAQNVERYAEELQKRGGNPNFAAEAKNNYEVWKEAKAELDLLLEKKNAFNKKIGSLSPTEREDAL
jgi:seryl-tRNA synthetase